MKNIVKFFTFITYIRLQLLLLEKTEVIYVGKYICMPALMAPIHMDNQSALFTSLMETWDCRE